MKGRCGVRHKRFTNDPLAYSHLVSEWGGHRRRVYTIACIGLAYWENTRFQWRHVTCKNCLRRKPKGKK